MPTIKHNLSIKDKRKRRVRSKLHGTAARPRLSVFRSNKYIYAQAIDDDKMVTLASASDLADNLLKGTKLERAEAVANKLVVLLKEKKVKQLVFDRGHCRYHGRVKQVAEVLRKAGIKL